MNLNLFNTRKAGLPAADTRNLAGGKAYTPGAEHRLAQLAVTGCLNNTFYAGAGDQLGSVLEAAKACSAEFVARTALYARRKGYMKDMPALLLAHLANRDLDLLAKIFPRVIDDGKMLRNFVQAVRSGITGRKSLGSAPRRLVKNWLAARSDDQLFRASVGQQPSLADVVKMVHPRPATPQRQALYAWLCGRKFEMDLLPPLVRDFEAFKTSTARGVPDVPFQMLTSLSLTREHWTRIALTASWQTTRMNLNTFARHGVLEDPDMAHLIAARLRDPAQVEKARVFPYQLLAAFMNAGADVPAEVKNALQDAMETATRNIPSIRGKVWVLPDISGSMHSSVTGYRKGATSAVRCLDVAALIAACFLRSNHTAEVLPFSDRAVPARLNPRDSVMTNAAKLAALPAGGTDCAAPLRRMNQLQARGDLVIMVSDNESWSGYRNSIATGVMQEWDLFRQRNRGARLVCLDIQPGTTTQAPDLQNILNIGGFSDQVFSVIAAFASGSLSAAHWAGQIGQIPLDG